MGNGTICFEKGMRCSGGFEGDKEEMYGHGGMECEGGLNADFEVESSGKYIADRVTQTLTEQMKDFMPENIEELIYPSDETLMEITELGETGDGLDSVLVQFGGMIEAKWGCNVTVSYDKDDGKFSKKVACGFEGHGGKGIHVTGDYSSDEIVIDE